MKNNEIKPIFERVIPKILNGDYSESCELANALLDYTWSYSKLKSILDSNLSFLNNLIKPFEDTDATILGKMFHAHVLKTEIPKYHFENINGRNKAGIARILELKEQGISAYYKTEIKETAERLAEKILNCWHCGPILKENGDVEIWRQSTYRGFNIGGYIDKETVDMCIELKSASSCKPDEFSRKSIDLGYPLQAKIYNLLTGKYVVYPVIETSGINETILFNTSGDYLDYGQYQLDTCIEKLDALIELLQNESYVGWGLKNLQIPSYKKFELDQWKKEKEVG